MLKKHKTAERISIPGTDPVTVLEHVCEAIKNELLESGSVSLPHLGKLKIAEKKSRAVVNNVTKVKYCVGKRKKIVFSASDQLYRLI